jgi:hypothetical protein
MINNIHKNTFVRLGASRIQGVGVFAIRDIPANTNIFKDDICEMVWFDESEFKNAELEPEVKKMFMDFCVLRNGMIGGPINFNSLTPAWYINEAPSNVEPNVFADKDLNFISSKNIKKGEELMAIYSTYSDYMNRY